eukprot:TRINITY_DN21218_c0_g1_i1.p1 TRINITY_DN21218_c0_g1~~TRINITY_DN21218_c0_g1_i1.p1  ORF type:complete len:146 (-),score=16.93 TRINITY_DN21218_c0_g1_i1:12-449(-)
MDLQRALIVHFLISCFLEQLTSIEIVTLKTKGSGKDMDKNHVRNKLKNIHKKMNEIIMRKEVRHLVDTYKSKMAANESPKVEVIDGAVHGTDDEQTETTHKNYTNPCKTSPCHFQAICISIGENSYETFTYICFVLLCIRLLNKI